MESRILLLIKATDRNACKENAMRPVLKNQQIELRFSGGVPDVSE